MPQLAINLVIHPTTCSSRLDELEKSDFIYRKQSDLDQRYVYLCLTDKGKKLLDNTPTTLKSRINHSLRKLSIEQLNYLNNDLLLLASAAKN